MSLSTACEIELLVGRAQKLVAGDAHAFEGLLSHHGHRLPAGRGDIGPTRLEPLGRLARRPLDLLALSFEALLASLGQHRVGFVPRLGEHRLGVQVGRLQKLRGLVLVCAGGFDHATALPHDRQERQHEEPAEPDVGRDEDDRDHRHGDEVELLRAQRVEVDHCLSPSSRDYLVAITSVTTRV